MDHPALIAIGILVAHALLVGFVWRITGTRYVALVDSREHVVRGVILPIGIGAVFPTLARLRSDPVPVHLTSASSTSR